MQLKIELWSGSQLSSFDIVYRDNDLTGKLANSDESDPDQTYFTKIDNSEQFWSLFDQLTQPIKSDEPNSTIDYSTVYRIPLVRSQILIEALRRKDRWILENLPQNDALVQPFLEQMTGKINGGIIIELFNDNQSGTAKSREYYAQGDNGNWLSMDVDPTTIKPNLDKMAIELCFRWVKFSEIEQSIVRRLVGLVESKAA
ncbi:MAG: hypothetical protein LBC43_04965 [Bifidobacteriaceae bacterium]|jgi:hypothetical protein|nr:hypothetical protein [Bifidobacteriaceae bacterium]